MMKKFVWLLPVLVVLFATCKQSTPDVVLGREGDVVHFSGRLWDIKSSGTPVGPGPNNFSRLFSDVWVDENGYLHLNIAKHNNQWYSSEVVAQDTMGYGTYVFTVQADPMSFSENVVFGLFTWDNNTFYTDGNSEVDIEFSKWGDVNSTTPTTLSVQPVNFGTYYAERTHEVFIPDNILKGVTTHLFHWTPTLITWECYAGENYQNATPVAGWSFDLNHPGRIKTEGGQSSLPIVIPAPGNTTHARMNFWTLPYQQQGPNNGLNHEVVIRKFEYFPL